MIDCEYCGKTILSDKPIKCPFCGKRFTYLEDLNTCQTCGTLHPGLECPACGDELCHFGGSSLYQQYIQEQNKK